MKKITQPDYRRIYEDIIKIKHPEKKEICEELLSKAILTGLDVIKLNDLIFSPVNRDNFLPNKKHRSYDESSILEILTFQKKHGYSNAQIAAHFKLSRNTITSWKKNLYRNIINDSIIL
ncbi:hypothetical protein HNP38_002499 [Chryseobacterium defluvii]|uniref:Terminase ATPase subunit N-terminal domain-containing protein n=1 Tax=Chryseobacterium defluvii TaxID=160396 RepID=A0A840KF43_9FLAO|nr:helix-turn-helix domain containing protein [Chryseobacterium defluvii]MBB4807195.1 hypothetical protein [Chryseobacterium defluvii]